MADFHMAIGSLVVIGYIAVLLLNIRTAKSGAEFSWQKMVTFAAAAVLLFQYVLGFSLLRDSSISGFHYLIGLAAIIPVGFEHMYATQRQSATERGKMGALANAATLILVLVAYLIGKMSVG